MIFQAITTKYIGPSNHRGSRIKATAAAGSITLPYNSAINSEANHQQAAHMLASKFKWGGHWFGGGMPDDKGNCYVCVTLKAGPQTVYFTAAFTTQGEG